MSTIIFKFLILFTVLIEQCKSAQSAPANQIKVNRIIREVSSNTLNLESSQTDDKLMLNKIDKFDRLQSNVQNSNSVLIPFELNDIEENTKNVIYWTPENYPNPFVDFRNCSLDEKGYICDPDEILEQEDINKLRQSIEGLNEDLDNHCAQIPGGKKGIDFGIAIMNQFQEIENKTLRETAGEYAEKLRHKWNLGGQCDNGLLILQSSKDSILTYSIGKTAQRLIKNVTINALGLNMGNMANMGDISSSSVKEETIQPLGQIQGALIKLSTGLSFVNREKALKKLDKIVHDNPKIGNVMKNVEATLDRQIEEQEKAHLNELNGNNDRYNGVNGELLLIYFLMFVLMLTIACFILGVFLKRRLGNSEQTRNASINNNSLHNFNTSTQCAYSSLGEKSTQEKQLDITKRYQNEYVPVPTTATNNNDSTNPNLNTN